MPFENTFAGLVSILFCVLPVWAGHVEAQLAQISEKESVPPTVHAPVQKRLAKDQPELRITVAVRLSLSADYLKSLAQSCADINRGKTTCRMAVEMLTVDLPVKQVLDLSQASEQSVRKALSDFTDSGMQTRLQIAVQEGLKKLSEALSPTKVQIDPEFFRKYAITSAPTFVFEHFENGQPVTTGVMTGAVALEVAVGSAMEQFEVYRKGKISR